MGAFVAEGLRGRSLSESPVFGRNRRHQCSRLPTSHVSTLVPPAIAACSTDRTRDAWHSLPPAFDQEPRRDGISSFRSPCHHRTGHKGQPSPGWLVCAKARRHGADVATKMSGPILFACTLLGVRVTCGADPLLALRSRQSFKEIGVSLPEQEIRPLATSFSGATAVWVITVASHSEPRMHSVTESPLMALALYGVFERLRHAIGFRVTSHVAFSFPSVARPSAVLQGHFTSLPRHPIQSLFD